MARVGGIIALVIAPLKRIWKPLPMTILGSVAVIAGLFAIAFPETTGEKMPETMEEALNIGKKQKRITERRGNGIWYCLFIGMERKDGVGRHVSR